MFKLQITLDRHCPRLMPNNCLLPNPPNSSLLSTFKKGCHLGAIAATMKWGGGGGQPKRGWGGGQGKGRNYLTLHPGCILKNYSSVQLLALRASYLVHTTETRKKSLAQSWETLSLLPDRSRRPWRAPWDRPDRDARRWGTASPCRPWSAPSRTSWSWW